MIDINKIFTYELFMNSNEYKIVGHNIKTSLDIVIPSEYNGLPVTSIGEDAFAGCKEINKVIIPDSVKIIEDGAFSFCFNLKSINLSSSLISIGGSSFEWCDKLSDIIIPNTVKLIDDYAFHHCSKLGSFFIPESVDTIGNGVFGECYNLKKIEVDSSNKNFNSINGVLYDKSVTELLAVPCDISGEFIIDGRINKIANHAFEGCNKIDSIIIPNTVKSIGSWSFFGCDKITSLIIPESVNQIEEAAFHSCESLKEIILPDNITVLPSLLFSDCTKLANITIPPKIVEIKDTVFRGCTTLSSISIPSITTKIDFTFVIGCTNLKKISVDVNNKVFYTKDGILYCKGLNDYICVPQGIRGIVSIPEEIDSIFGFFDCIHLESVILPKNTKHIGYGAFENCIALKEIIIPESVKCVDGMAFSGCTNLTIRIVGKHNIKDDWSIAWNESNCPVVWEN